MPTTPAIEVCGVTKRFGAVTALDNVSFGIEPGELFFLLGPSGCGKTTLLRILAGLETPDAGSIRFNGRDVAELPPHERGAPMVFQNYALWPHLNVRDNVAFGLVERKVPRREIATRVDEALERVGLQGYGTRMPGQLSGGQQQRVVLARALVLNPPVVLLDEPLSNLDAKLRVEMRAEIEELHQKIRITFLYVTHDQADALALADRMAVMNAGRVSAIGTPLDLYARPPNAFCADFLGESNVVEGGRWTVEGGRAQAETALGVWTVDGQAKAGDKAVCLVRPENLQVMMGPAEGFNTFEATITGLRMNGPTVTVSLDAGGLALRATLLTQQGAALRKGQRCLWGVAAVNTIVLLP
jgi:iron(III) transport system ATP-binding protein